MAKKKKSKVSKARKKAKSKRRPSMPRPKRKVARKKKSKGSGYRAAERRAATPVRGVTAESLTLPDPTELPTAVSEEIEAQLRVDGKWPPVDPTRIMRDHYRYDRNTMGIFLRQVKSRLEARAIPHTFTVNLALIDETLPMAVVALAGKISGIAT